MFAFIKKIFRKKSYREERYNNIFLNIKLFGIQWVWESIDLPEFFLEEYAEQADWKKILNHQKLSDSFISKFIYEFKSAGCGVVSLEATLESSKKILVDEFKNIDYKSLGKLWSVEYEFCGKKGISLMRKFTKNGIYNFGVKDTYIYRTAYFRESLESSCSVVKINVKNSNNEIFFHKKIIVI